MSWNLEVIRNKNFFEKYNEVTKFFPTTSQKYVAKMSLRRNSSVSVASRFTALYPEEEPHYDDLSDEEIKQTLEQAIQVNRTLMLENDVFERYLQRNDPQSLLIMSQVLDSAKHAQRLASQIVPMTSALSLTGSGLGFVVPQRGTNSPSISSIHTYTGSRKYTISQGTGRSSSVPSRISTTHRIEMANKEIEEMRKSLADLEQLAIKTRASLRAQMEEVEIRIQETHEARAELEENVIKKGVDPLTGKIPAEKFVRFMEEWLKAADSIIEKLRLKSATLKSQIKKAKQQLAQKEELGETLHAIDFEQLAIENQDFVRQIEEKNQYLLEMKTVTGRCSLKLASLKQKLSEQTAALKAIKRGIAQKEQQIEKLQKEQSQTVMESQKAGEHLISIIQLMDEYTVPDVLEFVKLQGELREMEKTFKRLNRHRKIQLVAIKACKRKIRQVTGSKTVNEPWFKEEDTKMIETRARAESS